MTAGIWLEVARGQEKHAGKGLPFSSRVLFLGTGSSSRGTEMLRNDSFFLTYVAVEAAAAAAAWGRVWYSRKQRAWASKHLQERQSVWVAGDWEFCTSSSESAGIKISSCAAHPVTATWGPGMHTGRNGVRWHVFAARNWVSQSYP